MNKSETIGALALALSKAQGQYKPIVKNCINPFFKSKYADLSSIIDSTKEALTKNELSIIQTNELNPYETGMLIVTTTLLHSSGEWISGTLSMKPLKEDPQSQGSCLTYLRRYTMQQILGVAAEDEDDGNLASTEKPKTEAVKQPEAPPKGAETPISEAQAKRFYAIAKGAGWDDKGLKVFMLTNWGIDSTKKIPKWNYEEYCEIIGKGPAKDPDGCTKDPATCEVSVYGQDGKADCNGKPCLYQKPELFHTKEAY